MKPAKVYYEPNALDYELGGRLKQQFSEALWIPIESHNSIPELQKSANSEFGKMKQNLIVGVRKTHKYVPNHKTSDFLVPYTSSGCSAACLYCYLVCNYNKCSYLRLFVNREQMLDKLKKTAAKSDKELTFEIGSNSDLVLENTITGNLEWTIQNFAKGGNGFLTLPTKFDMVDSLLPLEHGGRTIIRMSVNPVEVIKRIEFGTSPLDNRIAALNALCEAGYKVGLLIAPVVLIEGWKEHYAGLIDTLAQKLSDKVKSELFIEIIFMTYSYVHRAINSEAFPGAIELYDKELMTGRGRGRYCYKQGIREDGEAFLRSEIETKLGAGDKIVYVV